MKLNTIVAFVVMITLAGCGSNDDDKTPATKLDHQGQKWNISSVDYQIVNVAISNPATWVKNGTAKNSGAFYFNGNEGSYNILINNERREDYFGYQMDGSSVNIISIDQNISLSKFSQNVIVISGDKDTNTMTLQGTITSQSTAGEYVFTGTFTLTRE